MITRIFNWFDSLSTSAQAHIVVITFIIAVLTIVWVLSVSEFVGMTLLFGVLAYVILYLTAKAMLEG